jgi:hypothetical protein
MYTSHGEPTDPFRGHSLTGRTHIWLLHPDVFYEGIFSFQSQNVRYKMNIKNVCLSWENVDMDMRRAAVWVGPQKMPLYTVC